MEFSNNLKIPKLLNLSNDITFGIEIEFEKVKLKDVESKLEKSKLQGLLSNGWILKQDDSLIKYKDSIGIGGELTSPILTDTIKSYKEIRNACHIIKSIGGISTTDCGGHIHIGSNILKDNPKYYIRLMKLWFLFEDEIARFSIGENLEKRINMDFYAKSNYEVFSNAYLYENLNYLELLKYIIDDKKHGISFFYLDENKPFHTIEIRCPNGTVNENIWKNNINFFIKLLLSCSNNTKNWDEIDYLYKNANKIKKDKYNIDINVEKANYLKNFIFDNEFDKENFMLQYKKDSKIKIR